MSSLAMEIKFLSWNCSFIVLMYAIRVYSSNHNILFMNSMLLFMALLKYVLLLLVLYITERFLHNFSSALQILNPMSLAFIFVDLLLSVQEDGKYAYTQSLYQLRKWWVA